MNPTVRKVAGILTSDFNMNNYVDLVREIFSTVKIVAPDSFHKEYSNFSSHVDGSYHVGMYQSPDDKKIAIFAVQLQKQSFVENSRSTQRSYAKKLIENGNCDAALIAYYTPGDPKWRLSFVRLDFEMKLENGKLKASENITPAKRYSYLVGKDEPCHTAIDRFHKFIADNNSEPTMAELEEAFSVEAVTNEFFQLYCEKFYQLSDWLTQNDDFLAEAERCGFTVEQYAKKLLGQIVFLYFLQKKGWLGVGVWNQEISEKEYKNIFFTPGAQGRIIKQYLPQIYSQKGDKYVLNALALDQIPDDAEEMIANHVPGERHWGSGSKTFLRTLFKYSQVHKKHFFDNYLEPLFYDTLNRNRGRLGYSCFLHCRIPFLSGGLFEPLDGYDWRSCNFDIPDEIFSNKKFDEDLEGDGILDIFDRYNFTMSEDEPMEREVAIDPEMLGKVFENLLDVKDRKSKGAFYTPREIVHYMCQESLINYLSTNSHISEDAIRDFILYGDFYKDIDTEKTLRTTDENGKTHYEIDPAKPMKISEEIFSLSKGVNNLKLLDDLLANIRVADPAVGSGAFPLGMLNEVVRARQNLSAYMAIGMNAYDTRLMYTLERSPYMLKYTTIKNCIFAADIEPSAVDIARLRLWLSLVIDDEINPNAQNSFEGHQNPSPLPNLECNIVCGNSLVDEFEGTPLINASSLIGTTGQLDFNSARFESILPKLFDVQDRLYRCDDPVKKDDIKEELADVKDMLIRAQISLMSDSARQRYEQSKRLASKPYVLWQIDFAKVFNEKGGFDVVIGNPPYVDSEEMTRSMPELRELYTQRFSCAKGNWDLFVLFIEKGITLLKPEGVISFIVPNKLVSAPYTVTLRKQISQYQVQEIRDYSNVNVFKSAAVYPVVFRIKKIENKTKVNMDVMEDMYAIRQHSLVEPKSFYADIDWVNGRSPVPFRCNRILRQYCKL
ncbi:Eco57I restriction-modification methylase domain-containing protein [Bacillota bacterium LCP21S3_D8]